MTHQQKAEEVDILVAEDSPTQAEQLNHLLTGRGFTVRVARNGTEALAAARERRPTLIISDVVMPGMDGYTLCKKIKSLPELKDTPVILVTSLSGLQDVAKGMECGADNFIRKPYDERSLLARIDYILVNRELRRNTRTEFGVDIFLAGQKHRITSERWQILDLLISTYEEAVRMNQELEERQRELSRAYQSLDALYRVAVNLNGAATERDVAARALECALELPGVQAGWIYLRLEDGGFRTVAVQGGPVPAGLDEPLQGDCRCLRDLLPGTLGQAVNISECERLQKTKRWAQGDPHHASVPLWISDRTLGLMNLVAAEQGLFSEEQLKILNGVGNQVAVALERAQLLEQLEKKVEERTAALTAEIAERGRAEEARRASEERYRDLVENANDIVYTLDLEGNFTSMNKAGEEILGYTRGEALRMNFRQVLAPEYLDRAGQMLEGQIAGEAQTSYEAEFVARDGRRVALEASTRLIRQGSRPVGVQVIARDLTERRQLEQQLWQSQKMEAVGRLAGGVAHDFNNLLTVIKGYSELLLDELGQDDRQRRAANEINQAADRAAALTRQLLAFSRRQVLEPKVLDLNAVVANMDKMLRRLIGEDVDLVSVLRPELGRVKADPGQVEQVIMNLAVNARDAMPQGGKLTVETANVELDEVYARNHVAVAPGPYVMLAVSDTGCGMSAEVQARIFEPFFTTKEVGKGTGLGLATAYGIVKQSGGNIWVYSEPGHGTAFKIYLPAVEETLEPGGPRRPQAAAHRGSETILLVEDEEKVRELVRDILQRKGYTVLEASHGDEALEIIQRHQGPVHLMLTDVVMPRMSGRELFERLRPVRPEIKVVYMSGYTDGAIVHHGVLEEGTPFLQKPLTPDAVQRKVREVLDAAKSP